MRPVYLIAAPEDEAAAKEIAALLKRFGVQSRLETGKFGFPPARPNEATVTLWSQKAVMSAKRLLLTNRAIDAWADEALVLCQLDHGFLPTGLRDVEAVDLRFEPQRQFKAREIADRLRAIEHAQNERSSASLEPFDELFEDGGDELFEDGGQVEPDPSDQAPPSKRRGLFARLFGRQGPNESRPAKPVPDAAKAPGAESEASASHVFVSYSHSDKDSVWPLVDEVETSGVDIWIDREIEGGEGWAGAIVRAIKGSGAFCIMCSERAFQSDHVRREIYLADKYKKALVPVVLEDAEMPEDIEYFLIDRQWVRLDACPPGERSERLRAALAGGA
ncbi:MAG: toll/interleukin-1 receptor domain-containing protein [Pseudomonadota bacterium]